MNRSILWALLVGFSINTLLILMKPVLGSPWYWLDFVILGANAIGFIFCITKMQKR